MGRLIERGMMMEPTAMTDIERVLRRAHASGFVCGHAAGRAAEAIETKRARFEWYLLTAAVSMVFGIVLGGWLVTA